MKWIVTYQTAMQQIFPHLSWFSLCVSYWRKKKTFLDELVLFNTRFKQETTLLVLDVSKTSDSLCMDRNKKKGRPQLLIDWDVVKCSPVTNWLASYWLRLTYICEPHFYGFAARIFGSIMLAWNKNVSSSRWSQMFKYLTSRRQSAQCSMDRQSFKIVRVFKKV